MIKFLVGGNMKKNIAKIIITLLFSILLINGVEAKSIVEVDQDVKVTGDVESSRVVIGNNVSTEENVDGLSLVAANNANIKGSAPYAIYVGNMVTIESAIEKDLFIVANNANIGSEATISRDIYAFVNDMKINASGARNIKFIGSVLDLSGITVSGNVYANANEVIMDKNTVIEGKITCFDYTILTGKGEAKIGKVVEKTSKRIETVTLWDRIMSALTSAVSLFIVLAILIGLLPKVKSKMEKETLGGESILKTIAKGLLFLVAVPIICLLALFTLLLAPASLIAIALYAIVCYVSTGVASFIITSKLMSKYSKKNNPYINLLIGVVVVKLLALIPYVGSFIEFVFLLYGMGYIFKTCKEKIKA